MSIEHNPLAGETVSIPESQADAKYDYEMLDIGDTAVLASIDDFDSFFHSQVEGFRTRDDPYGKGNRVPFDVSAIKGRAIWIDEFKKPKGVYGGPTGRVLCTKIDACDVVPNLRPETPSFAMNIVIEGLSSRLENSSISYLSSLDMALTPDKAGYAGDVRMRFANKKLEGNLKSFELEHNRTIENALALARLAIQHPLQGGRADGNK